MRWHFVWASENDETVEYRYSFESEDLDGLISYNKATEEIELIRPSKNDKGSSWCMNRTIEKFYTHVVHAGFPESRIVITG